MFGRDILIYPELRDPWAASGIRGVPAELRMVKATISKDFRGFSWHINGVYEPFSKSERTGF